MIGKIEIDDEKRKRIIEKAGRLGGGELQDYGA